MTAPSRSSSPATARRSRTHGRPSHRTDRRSRRNRDPATGNCRRAHGSGHSAGSHSRPEPEPPAKLSRSRILAADPGSSIWRRRSASSSPNHDRSSSPWRRFACGICVALVAGMTRRAAALVLVLVATSACVGPGGLLVPPAPHAAYVVLLQRSGLADSADARLWLDAATRVLEQAAPTAPPFRAHGGARAPATADAPRDSAGARPSRAAAACPIAVALRRGDASALTGCSLDLCPRAPRRAAAGWSPGLPSGRRFTLVHDVDEPGGYVVRAQTEVAASGRRPRWPIRTLAWLPFPTIQSVGQRRDPERLRRRPRRGAGARRRDRHLRAARDAGARGGRRQSPAPAPIPSAAPWCGV